MGTKKSSKESELSKYIKVPIKILGRAMSLYIKSSEHVSFGTVPIGCPTGAMVRSYSVGSSTSTARSRNGGGIDYRAEPGLSRSASTGNNNNLGIVKIRRRKIGDDTDRSQRKQGVDEDKWPTKVPRSSSVGIGRID